MGERPVLIIDTDCVGAKRLAALLADLAGGSVTCTQSVEQARASLNASPSLVFVGATVGVSLAVTLHEVLDLAPAAAVVVTSERPARDAVVAIQAGAVDVVPKLPDLDGLRHLVASYHDVASSPTAPEPDWPAEDLVGDDPAMLALYKQVGAITRPGVRSTVLITGETGVGKTRLARTLHDLGATRAQPFVTVPCAGVPSELLENELFGHERGAYTGAATRQMGRIEAAGTGTVFLDEIGDLPPAMQVKLLRLLDTGEYERLGSSHTRVAKCRFIAATHHDLAARVAEGAFRADLYHRLRVISLHLPSLRDRPVDIDAFIDRFIVDASGQQARSFRLDDEARRALLAYPFPGNVRELKHLITGAASLSTGPVLTLDAFPPLLTEAAPTSRASAVEDDQRPLGLLEDERRDAMEAFEHDYVRRALQASAGNVSAAARHAGVSRQHLQRLMRKHTIDSAAYREAPRAIEPVRILRRTADGTTADVSEEETIEVASRR